MPIADCTINCDFGFSQSNWTPSVGTYNNCPDYVAVLAAEGSGLFMSNFPGFNTGLDALCDVSPSPIPAGSTVNSVTLVCDVRGTGLFPAINGLGILTSAGNYNTGHVAIGGGFGEVTALYPNPITLAQLINSEIRLGVDNTGGAVDCDYLAFRVDYTPPPVNLLQVWMPPWVPFGCGVPPVKAFLPFELIDQSSMNPADITALYATKYGQPPSGSLIWVIWRTVDQDYTPGVRSDIDGFTVP